MKKMTTKFIAVLSAACALASCSGGGGTSSPSTPEGGAKDVHIKLYLGGYGRSWLDTAIEQFKNVAPEYNLIVDEASTEVSSSKISEIKKFSKNDTDLYFLNGCIKGDLIKSSATTLKSNDKLLIEDLSDVYNSKAIGLDGKEESETIASRLLPGWKESGEYHGKVKKWEGGVYTLPWCDAMCGLVCNPAILKKYSLEIPRTSDEFKACIDEIESHTDRTSKDGIYSYGWAGNNAPGYWSFLFEIWFAQYSGSDAFLKFMKGGDTVEEITNSGYKVYQDPGIEKSLEGMFQILNNKYAPNGSASMIHTTAENQFMMGRTAFMIMGDWIAAEMKKTYEAEAKEMIMIKTPIISSLGTKLGLSSDAELSNAVKLIDEEKTDAEIITAVPALDAAKVKTLREARGVHTSIGTSHSIYIPSMADAKEGAKKFIRFLYSNDGCNIFRQETFANLPLKFTPKAGVSDCTYTKSLDSILNDKNTPSMISACAEYNDLRSVGQLYMFNNPSWLHPNTYANIMSDQSETGSKVLSANGIYTGEATYVQENWSTYVSRI